ncbi:MAG: TldD/PmbA family protein [Candidatus Bathyarchaeia archaeon]
MSEALARTEEVVRKGKALGADEVVARTTFGQYRQTRFSNNQVDITVAWNDYATDVALSWRKRFVATQIRDFRNVDESVKRLFELAKVSKENPAYGGVAKGTFQYEKSAADRSVAEVEDPAEYVSQALEAAREGAGSEVNAGGILLTRLEDVYLVSSEGPVGEDSRSGVELSIRVFSEREASGHGVECSSTLKSFDPARAGFKAGEVAALARKPEAGVEGRYDVVFDPLFVGSLLAMWGGMASAYEVMTQRSIFVDKLGEKVASDLVTLRDVPAAYSLGNRVFDDEGVPARGNLLISRGVLRTYLHNTSTARLFKTETTGNAGLVVPTPWNLELDPGEVSSEEMLGDLKHGLYLTNTWYTRFQNYATGDFSTIPRDGIFLVEKGGVKQSWKDVRLSDNALRMLNNIAAVSKERQHVHWWEEADPPSLAPYILIRDVQVTRPHV